MNTLLIFPLGLFMIIPLLVGIYVYRDATIRGMNATLWTLIAVLSPTLIGFIIYLMVRSDYSAIQCPNCGTPVTDQYAVCPNCGTPLKAKCSNCSRPLEPSWKICASCGTPVPDDLKMPIVNVRKDKGLGKILLAVLLIPLIIITILFAGLASFRGLVSSSIASTGGMRVEDYAHNRTISAWLDECGASGNDIYVLENKRQLSDKQFQSSYIIYRNELTSETDISTEGLPKSLFKDAKLIIDYKDSGVSAYQNYHLYQIDYITSDEPELEILVNGSKAPFKITTTSEPLSLPYTDQIPLQHDVGSLFDARIDYVGDNSGVINLIYQTKLPALGELTTELKTSEQPYGLKIIYDSPIGENDDKFFSDNSIKLLGLVKNLDYVEITDKSFTYKITAAEASEKLRYDVKELGQSKDSLEKYLNTINK